MAVGDGGEDAPENVDVLCEPCHGEWHRDAEGRMAYETFLWTCPARMLAMFQVLPSLSVLTQAEITAAWRQLILVRVLHTCGLGVAAVDGALSVSSLGWPACDKPAIGTPA